MTGKSGQTGGRLTTTPMRPLGQSLGMKRVDWIERVGVGVAFPLLGVQAGLVGVWLWSVL